MNEICQEEEVHRETCQEQEVHYETCQEQEVPPVSFQQILAETDISEAFPKKLKLAVFFAKDYYSMVIQSVNERLVLSTDKFGQHLTVYHCYIMHCNTHTTNVLFYGFKDICDM